MVENGKAGVMKVTPEAGQGNVTVVVEGKEMVLKPTLSAFKTLCRQYGGLTPTLERIQQLDLQAIVMVVAVGVNYKLARIAELEQAVWNTGLGGDDPNGLAPKCMEYVTNLMRGGAPAPMREDSDAERDYSALQDPLDQRTQ